MAGRHHDEFIVDAPIGTAIMEPYSGLALVGGVRALTLLGQPDVLRLVHEAVAPKKLMGARGHAVATLARSGVLS